MGSVIWLVIACIFLAGVIGLIGLVVYIRGKINKYKKEFRIQSMGFGSGFGSGNVSDNVHAVGKNQASLNGMDRIYEPMINKDFPDLQLSAVKPMVETVIKTYLNAIEDGSTEELKKLTIAPSLVDRADQIITDVRSQGTVVHFDNIVIHKTVISEYVRDNGIVTIRFQSAVGYYRYVTDEKGRIKSGSRDAADETVYVVDYSRILDSEIARESGIIDVIGLNCPNCGAPLRSSHLTHCEFCGTGVQNLTEDVFGWTFTDIKEKNRMTTKLF